MLARPHCLGYPMMIVWFCGLARASEGGRRPSFWLLPVMLLWANLHSSFTFGLLAAGGFALDAVLRADRRARLAVAAQWGVFLALSLAASCATPYGAELILMTRKIYELGDALGQINEWQPTNFRDLKLIAVVLMLWLLAALWFRPPLPLGRVLLAVGITYMALQATRNLELFGFLMPIVVAGTLGLRVSPDGAPFLPRVSGAVFAGIGALLVACAVLALVNKNVAPSETLLVTKALDEARDRGLLQKRVFNSYGLGGQIIAPRRADVRQRPRRALRPEIPPRLSRCDHAVGHRRPAENAGPVRRRVDLAGARHPNSPVAGRAPRMAARLCRQEHCDPCSRPGGQGALIGLGFTITVKL